MKKPVPCPCGSPSTEICVTEIDGIRAAWVECSLCGTSGPIEAFPSGMTEEDAAIDAWNKLFERTESLQTENAELCHADETETWECVCDQIGSYGKRITVHVMECSKCGGTYEHVNGSYEHCPRCGRKVE